MEEVTHSFSNYVQVLPHSYGVHMSARRPTAPATECLATKCHMDPVPQATKCQVPYNRRRKKVSSFFSAINKVGCKAPPTLLIPLIS